MRHDVHLKSIKARVYRAPIDTPVMAAFGAMHNRPMVLLEAEDRDGNRGFGEIWCNFPQVGAEHRARVHDSLLAPLGVAAPHESPAALFRHLTAATEVMAIQCGEPGTFAHAIAGIDIAVSDLVARRAGQPLWRLLGGASPTIKVYASGLNPTSPEVLAKARHDEGYRAFKLKIGFGADRDVANLRALRAALGDTVELMVDANQSWSPDAALEMAPRLEPFRLGWLEEPLRADRPWEDWRRLKAATSIPLAAGENIYGVRDFERALATGLLGVVQPDLAKWGGFSGCREVAGMIARAGAVYCPHYLGAGIGLLASAHLLAAAGGMGSLEIDANANPLRELLSGPLNRVHDGRATLTDAPGLGIEPDLGGIERFRVPH